MLIQQSEKINPIIPDELVLEDPEWMTQRCKILAGKATWKDFSFSERTCKGWLLPYLWEIDAGFSGRWQYWTRTLENGAPLDEPIPRIDFLDSPAAEAMKNIQECLSQYNRYDFSLSDFLQWLLWGFGAADERARICDAANEFLYRTFNLGFLLKHPHDYFGQILVETKAGYWNNPNAFYPTPHTLCCVMAEMTFADTKKNGRDLKTKTVLDPCVGTGRMLMYASNYSLFLYGQDIDRVCCMASQINGYLYMPWLVRAGLPRPVVAEETPDSIATEITPDALPATGIVLQSCNTKNNRTSKPQQLTLF